MSTWQSHHPPQGNIISVQHDNTLSIHNINDGSLVASCDPHPDWDYTCIYNTPGSPVIYMGTKSGLMLLYHVDKKGFSEDFTFRYKDVMSDFPKVGCTCRSWSIWWNWRWQWGHRGGAVRYRSMSCWTWLWWCNFDNVMNIMVALCDTHNIEQSKLIVTLHSAASHVISHHPLPSPSYLFLGQTQRGHVHHWHILLPLKWWRVTDIIWHRCVDIDQYHQKREDIRVLYQCGWNKTSSYGKYVDDVYIRWGMYIMRQSRTIDT